MSKILRGLSIIFLIVAASIPLAKPAKSSDKARIVFIKNNGGLSEFLYQFFRSRGVPVVLVGDNGRPTKSSIIDDTVKSRLTRDDIWDLIRIARGEEIPSVEYQELRTKTGLDIDPVSAGLILKSLDTTIDRDPEVIFLGKYNMYINLRNSYAAMEHWLVNLENYDSDHDKIADKLEEIIAIGTEKIVIPGRKVMLDLGDMIVPIDEIGPKTIEIRYSRDDLIFVDVAAADRRLEEAIAYFKSMGGTIETVYREICAFSGYIELYKVPLLSRSPLIGFIEQHNEYFYPMTSWTVLQMRIGTLSTKLVPPNSYPMNNETPWGRGIFGDPSIAIAIVDTGIDDTHPLTNKVIYWYDYSGDDATSPEDYHGHGTHCASIAAGNIWTGDYVEWGIIARNRTDSFGASGNYYLYIDSPGWYGVAALYYTSSGTADISFEVYDPNHVLLNTSRQVYASFWGTVEIEQAVFNASLPGTYNVSVTNLGTTGGTLIVTWEKQFPYGSYGSQPGRHAGVAPEVKLVGLKIFDRSGWFGDYNFDSIRWLIQNASDYNITVSSNSWGGGDDATLNELMNQLVMSGVVTVVAAGNDGAGGNIGSPGSADLVITVAAMNDINEISEYSTSGDTTTGNTIKPDVSANGGTGYYNGDYIDKEDSDLDGSSGAVAAADSNDADNAPSGGGLLGDAITTLDNFWDIQGTSMATPHVSGLAALVVSALGGASSWVWDGEHALKVKMLILMTSVEFTRAETGQTVPSLDRGGKDNVEGYGRVNGDAAVMAVLNELFPNRTYRYTLGSNNSTAIAQGIAPRVWAGKIYLEAGSRYRFNLTVPSGADFDLYIYYGEPDEYGQPVIAGKSTSDSIGGNEVVDIIATKSGYYYVVVKWVDRSATTPSIPDEQNYGEFTLHIDILDRGIPIVEIIEPEEGDIIEGVTRIYVNATDVDGTITYVYLNISNSTWGTVVDITSNYDASRGLYYYDWDTSTVADGYYMIFAGARDNESKTNNDTIQVHVWNNIPPILLVDDDKGDSYETYYEQALQDLGYQRDIDYIYWDVSVNGTPTKYLLDRVVIVIWFTGDDFTTTLTTEERDVLEYYLSRCGQLFISGQDIGFDIGDTTWYSTWLKANYERDDTNIDYVRGVSGTLFGGAIYNLSGTDSANNNDFPDEISPTGGSTQILYYDDDTGIGAGVMYDDEYRLVYMSFPFEAIDGSVNRSDAMQRATDWMKAPIAKIYDYSFYIDKYTENVSLAIAARAYHYIRNLEILINGTVVYSLSPGRRTYINNITIDTSSFPSGTLNITLRIVDNNLDEVTDTIFISREHLYLDLVFPNTYDPVWSTTRILVNASTYSGVNLTTLNVTISNETWSQIIDILSNYDSQTGYYYYDWDTTGVADGSYNISVSAITDEGSSKTDNVYNIGVWNGIVPILLVDDDNWHDYEQYFMEALENLSYHFNRDYAYWNTTRRGAPPQDFLDRVQIMIWECGLSAPNSAERNAISEFLSDLGQLFISGQDIGYLIGDTDWYKDWLRAIYERDDTNINNVSGVAGTIFEGVTYLLSGSDSANNNFWPDEISPTNGSFLMMYYGRDPSIGAAIGYDGYYRLVYFAYPFESINGSEYRADALDRILQWLRKPIGAIVSPENMTITNNDTIDIIVHAKAITGLDIIRIYVNGSLVVFDDIDGVELIKHYDIDVSGYPDYTTLNITLVTNSVTGDMDTFMIYIIRDKVPPYAEFLSPANGSYFNVTDITFEWNGTDNFGMNHYEIRIDGGAWIDVDLQNEYTFAGLDEGIHTVDLKAIDLAGNQFTTSLTVIVDLTPPVLIDIFPENDSYVQSKVVISWNFSDNYELDCYKIRLDGGAWIMTTSTSHVYEYLTEGEHSVYIRAYDKAGNVKLITLRIIADTTDPYIEITYPPGGTFLNTSTVYVEWYMSDNFELDHCEIRVDGGEWIDVGLASNYTISGMSEGTHIIDVRVYDSAGNYGEDTVVISIDLTPPIIVAVYPDYEFYINTTSTVISWDAIDNYGIDRYYVKVGDGAWIDVGLSNNYTVTGLVNGENTVYIKAVDKAGNADVEIVTIIVDTEPPTINIVYPSNGTYINVDNIIISWEANDNMEIERFEISINGGDWIDLGKSTGYAMAEMDEGIYLIVVRCYDIAGNANSDAITFIVDYTAPEFIMYSPPDGSYFNYTNIEIQWNATDNYGIDHYEVYVNNELLYSGTNSSLGVELSADTHSIKIIAYDYAGNSRYVAIVVHIDLQTPSIIITSPSDGAYINEDTISVAWSAIDDFGIDHYCIRIDNESWISITNNRYMFYGLSEGLHAIYVRAFDKAGNSAESNVSIIVDLTEPAIIILEPKNNSELNATTVTISWNATDNFDLDHIEISINNSAWQDIGLTNSIKLQLDYGKYIVKLRAYDKAGNMKEVAVVFIIKQIQAPPSHLKWLPFIAIGAAIAIALVLVPWWKRRKSRAAEELEIIEKPIDEEEAE